MNGEADGVSVKPRRSGAGMIVRILLWCGAGILCAVAVAVFLAPGGDPAGRGIGQALGLFLALVGGAAVGAMLLALRWRAWLWVAAVIIALPLIAVMVFWIIGVSAEAR